jgi:hypothetical protein
MGIPWALVPVLIAFFSLLVINLMLLCHMDEEKITRSRNPLTRNYIFWCGYVPAELLTAKGRRLRPWQNAFTVIFLVSLVITIIFYWH